MSIVAPTPSESDATLVPDEPGAVFREVIAQNPRVCRNCFRRIKRREPFPDEAGHEYADVLAHVETVLPEDAEWDLLDREYFESVSIHDRIERAHPPSESSATETTGSCWNCGACDYHRMPDTRAKSNAIQVAVNVTITLTEYGIEHDWLHLVTRVADLKSQPETAGDDFECFSTAVSEAIDRERGWDGFEDDA